MIERERESKKKESKNAPVLSLARIRFFLSKASILLFLINFLRLFLQDSVYVCIGRGRKEKL
jgi:hypothetical protein